MVYLDMVKKFLIPIYFWKKKVLMTCYSSKTEPLNIFTSHSRTSWIQTFHKNSYAEANIQLEHFLSLHLRKMIFFFSWVCITYAACTPKFCTPLLEHAARKYVDASTVNTCSRVCRVNTMSHGTYYVEHPHWTQHLYSVKDMPQRLDHINCQNTFTIHFYISYFYTNVIVRSFRLRLWNVD